MPAQSHRSGVQASQALRSTAERASACHPLYNRLQFAGTHPGKTGTMGLSNTDSIRSRTDLRRVLVLFVTVAAYVGLWAALGRFVSVDEVFFKSPGRHWARTGRFAAPELTGFLGDVITDDTPGVEEVWLAQPPGYSLAFGLFVRVFGFGPRQCVTFDALIHGVLVVLTYVLARVTAPELSAGTACAVAIALLPVGVFGRPDELAMCFGMVALILWGHPAPGYARSAGAALVLGLCGATSVGAALMIGILGLTQLLYSRLTVARKLVSGLIGIAVGLAVLALTILPIELAHPSAYRQYLAHAAGHLGHGSFWNALFGHWQYERFHRSLLFGTALIALLALARRHSRQTWNAWCRRWLGPAVAMSLLAVFFPDKLYYVWFIGPWMVIAAVASAREMWPALPGITRRAVVAVALCCYGVAIAPFCREVLTMATLPAAQRLRVAAERLDRLIPAGSSVMTSDYWWVLADRCRVYDPYFSRLPLEQIEYIVLRGDGSGNSTAVRDLPEYARAEVESCYRAIDDNINTHPLSILGVTIPNSAQGFGALVLKRVKPEPSH